MPKHVVVDGSNIATEGRSMPSLRQLNEAVLSYMEEHPTDLITVVVDATFGHRIDGREVTEFDEAIANNELVCPPAGAVGRGDAFVLSIANKVGATILSNDSFQEFHGDYPWLFDEGRLLGGKPVQHVGWVFVARTPVRGPISRKAVKAKKAKAPERGPRASVLASQPMPVPKSPPPGRSGRNAEAAAPAAATEDRPTSPRGGRRGGRQDAAAPAPAPAPPPRPVKHADAPAPASTAFVNEPVPFLGFVSGHPVGTVVEGTVDSYSSHGAYLVADGARCYVPLRYMAAPAPRAARDVVKLGASYSFVVVSFNAGRRSIDVAIPGFEPAEVTEAMAAAAAAGPAKKRRAPSKAAAQRAAAEAEAAMAAEPADSPAAAAAATGDVAAGGASRRGRGRGRGRGADGTAREPAAGTQTGRTPSGRRTPSAPAWPADTTETTPAARARRSGRRPTAEPTAAVAVEVAATPLSEAPLKAGSRRAAGLASAPVTPVVVETPAKATKQAATKAVAAAAPPTKATKAPASTAPTPSPTKRPSAKSPAPATATAKAPTAKAAPAKAPAEKSPAKKTPAKKSPAKKSPATKAAPAKAAPAKNVPAKKAATAKPMAPAKKAPAKAAAPARGRGRAVGA